MYKNLEPFPHPNAYKRFLDQFVYVAGIVGPLVTIPQLFQVYALQQASNLSLFTWSTYAFFDVIWILYGLAHKELPIVITYTLWFVMNGLMIVAILLF